MSREGLFALKCLATGRFYQTIEDGVIVWTDARCDAKWCGYSTIKGRQTTLARFGASTRISSIQE